MRIKLRFLLNMLVFCMAIFVADAQSTNNSADTLRAKKIVFSIKIVDIENGNPVSGARITSPGSRDTTTNEQGEVSFETGLAKPTVYITAEGYNFQSRSLKQMETTIRLVRNQYQSKNNIIDFGFYSRNKDHVSSEATMVDGEALRKINGISLLDALGVYEPGIIAFRNNLNGSDPNVASSLQIRGMRNFPTAAAVATGKVANSSGVQVIPSTADFVAQHIAQPNLPLLLLDGAEISLQQLADVNIFRVERVTILKDASSSVMYGARAANGVILVETSPNRKGITNLTYTGQVQVMSADLSSYNLLPWDQKISLESQAGMYNTSNQDIYQRHLAAVQDPSAITNWMQRPIQTGVGSMHSLQFDGGNDYLSYGLTAGYNMQNGAIDRTGRKITTLAAKLGASSRYLKFNTTIYYNTATSEGSVYGNLNEYTLQNPYWQTLDQYGRVQKIMEYPTLKGDTAYNPEYNASVSTRNSSNYYHLGNNTSVELKLRGGFSLTGRFSLSQTKDQTDLFFPAGHTMFANYPVEDYFKRGNYKLTTSEFISIEGNLNLNWAKQIGLHALYASAGVFGMSTASESLQDDVSGFTSDMFSDISFGSNYNTTAPVTGKINTRLLSGYSNFTYSFDNRYQAEFTFSRDGSSTFGSNNQYANYFGTAISWNLHNEHFFKQDGFINQLKIKAGTGVVGSRFFPEYLRNTSYNYFTNQQYIQGFTSMSTLGVGVGTYLLGVGNPELESPRFTKHNLGMDLVMFKNRIFVKASVFAETGEKLVLPELSPRYSGFTAFSMYGNNGGISNKGIEFSLAGVLLSGKKHKLSLGVNGLHTNNEIVAISTYIDKINSLNNALDKDQTRPQPLYVVGQPLDAIWAVPSLGLNRNTGNENFQTESGATSGVWNSADKIMAGTTTPKWSGTTWTSFNFKQFSLGLYAAYRFGGFAYNQTLADKVENADLYYNVDARAAADRWSTTNPDARFKALSANGMLTNPTYATTRFVETDNVFSLSSITLGYSLPDLSDMKIPLQNTSIVCYVNNLWQTGGPGMERGTAYPFARSFVLKLTTSIK